MKLVYGIDAAVDDPECEMAKAIEALRAFVETLLLPSGHLIMDIFPFLRHLPSWLPGMHVKRVVETGRRAVQGALDKLDNMSTAANVSLLLRFSGLRPLPSRLMRGAVCLYP